jgi:hypothetical protein
LIGKIFQDLPPAWINWWTQTAGNGSAGRPTMEFQ